MKKTLAAVLAAAMALSTATVALAKDTLKAEAGEGEDISVGSASTPIKYGSTYNFILSADVLDPTNVDITETELGKWLKEGKVTITPTVTQGRSALSSNPSVSVRNVLVNETVETVYQWDTGKLVGGKVEVDGKTVAQEGKKVYGIPLQGGGTFTSDSANVVEVIYPDDSRYETIRNGLIGAQIKAVKGSIDEKTTAPVARVSFSVPDTWGTNDTTVAMKFRITFKADVDTKAGGSYKKGDTVITDELFFKAYYDKMNDKGTEMELTRAECSNREVLMNKDGELYDLIDSKEFTLYFENAAAFTGRMAANQKVLNMYYTLDADDDGKALQDMYPDVDFEFIEFKGRPSFVNTGKMTFSAIGGDETVVYEWDGDGWTPISNKNDYVKTYNTIEVDRIKRLTKYAIASEMLPVEEEPEEPAEPVDSTPVAEPDDEGENPNTGAC